METFSEDRNQASPVKRALAELRLLRARLREAEQVRNMPIAIIGMGCRFPGGANDPASLWRLLCNGVDAIREVPPDRWDIDEFYDPNPDAPGKMSSRWGGFLDEVETFDADFFGISPREAVTMDPQQRLFLEVSWESLENAGQSPQKLLRTPTGVFVGIASNDYAQLQMQFGDPNLIDAYLATGTCHSVASGRLSYLLGLQGPSISIDTACSSSLVAIHLACQSLRLGECRLALAGGVNVILAPELLINFSKSHMMAADGRCKTFDAAADGFVRGEGCGVVVLKRLNDAVAEGDHILAVIRGTAINQDGRSSGLTVPNGSSQQDVIRQALANAGVAPLDVGYVETHGTGTSLGDPVEVRALNAIYGAGRSQDHPLALGSIKTNLGHLETAAGVAGLLKAMLVLIHGEIPPHLHFKEPSPHIPWKEYSISVPTQCTPWPSSSGRRIAAVSSFGFSGTNVHLVMEEAPNAGPLIGGGEESAERRSEEGTDGGGGEIMATLKPVIDRPIHLLTVSAKSEGVLKKLANRYEHYLAEHPEADIADVCYTANAGRSHFEHRLSMVAASAEQMRQNLAAMGTELEPAGSNRGHADLTQRLEPVFLFTGQGGQYTNMGRGLYESEPTFRDIVNRCDEWLRPHLPKPLLSVLYPRRGEATPLDETQYTHVAMFAVQCGLAQVWRSWGLEPGLVMGHSVGEIVAATVAGQMSLEDGLMIMRERGRLMQSLPPTGMMASLLAGVERVAPFLEPYRDRVSIAAVNGPESTVISGERTAVQEILRTLEAQGIKIKPLKVSNSFHSPLVEPVLKEFEQAAARATFRSPQMALFSSMRLELVGSQNLLDARYWSHNLRHTVRFSEAIGAVYDQGYRVFLEIGPSPILVNMASQCVPPGQGIWLPSLREGRNDWDQMLESLGTLYVNGADIDWVAFDRPHRRKKVMLPSYPWTRAPYWTEAAKTRQRGSHSQDSSPWQQVVTAARDQSRQVPIDLDLESYKAKWEYLDGLTAVYIAHSLRALGAFETENQSHTVDSLIQKCNILPAYRILLSRWLQKLELEGLLVLKDGSYVNPSPLPSVSFEACSSAPENPLADIPFVLEYMKRCGQMAAAVVTGESSPLETLFPGGSAEMAEGIYDHWALSRYFNGIAKAVVARLVGSWPRGRTLRLVEIGAGTGGTTSALLPLLPPQQTLYCFTDVSQFFFRLAERKYKDYPFLRFGLLDIERSPAEQGFGRHSFDLVIAANVLHATRNLDETIENVASLLGPGGILLLYEVTQPRSWIEFSYGLIEDWHRFNDGWRRESPLLSRTQWEQALMSHGFKEIAAFPEPGSPAEILGEHVIVARAAIPESISKNQDSGGDFIIEQSRISPAAEPIDQDGAEAFQEHRDGFLAKLRQAPAHEQIELLADYVRSRVMRVLRRDGSNPIDKRHRLMDLGIDSLMAVELRNMLSSGLGLDRPLPATLIYDYPNVQAITDYLAFGVLHLDLSSLEALSERSDENAASIPGALKIKELSDEEVEKLLLKKLETF